MVLCHPVGWTCHRLECWTRRLFSRSRRIHIGSILLDFPRIRTSLPLLQVCLLRLVVESRIVRNPFLINRWGAFGDIFLSSSLGSKSLRLAITWRLRQRWRAEQDTIGLINPFVTTRRSSRRRQECFAQFNHKTSSSREMMVCRILGMAGDHPPNHSVSTYEQWSWWCCVFQ